MSIVLPVYNEEPILRDRTLRLLDFMRSVFSSQWEIVIADNGSTDGTSGIGRALAEEYPEVKYLRIERRGVGISLRTAWQSSHADILCHVDGDLPFELRDIEHVIRGTIQGYDVCVGSRFAKGSNYNEKPLRKLLSKAFHYWIVLFFSYRLSDICGIKALRREAFQVLSPHLSDDGWFFNTEIVLLANRLNMSIKEIPVHLNEDPYRKSKVHILPAIVRLLVLTIRLRARFLIGLSSRRSRA